MIMIRLNIVGRDGGVHEEHVSANGTLMEALRELDYGMAAICGGMCCCATCHVYISPEWSSRVPAQQSDERDLVAELQYHTGCSRLACQISLFGDLDGLRLALPPEE